MSRNSPVVHKYDSSTITGRGGDENLLYIHSLDTQDEIAIANPEDGGHSLPAAQKQTHTGVCAGREREEPKSRPIPASREDENLAPFLLEPRVPPSPLLEGRGW